MKVLPKGHECYKVQAILDAPADDSARSIERATGDKIVRMVQEGDSSSRLIVTSAVLRDGVRVPKEVIDRANTEGRQVEQHWQQRQVERLIQSCPGVCLALAVNTAGVQVEVPVCGLDVQRAAPAKKS